MTPGLLDLTCPQGATFTKTLTWKVNGDPTDLTGWAARMQVRTRHAAPETLVDVNDTAGITLGGTAGTVTIDLPAAATSELPAGEWRYDLELVKPDGTVYRLVEGAFTVTPEVTR